MRGALQGRRGWGDDVIIRPCLSAYLICGEKIEHPRKLPIHAFITQNIDLYRCIDSERYTSQINRITNLIDFIDFTDIGFHDGLLRKLK
jgi:hypothetical protein